MKWKKFTLTTTTEAVDLVSSMLDDVGIEGIEVEDNVPLTEKETKGMFIDILPELPPDEGVAKVSFYLDDDDQVEEMLRRVNEGLDELAAYTELGQRTVRWSDLDGNGHLYSANYGDIIWDYLPPALQERVPREFYINYSHEALLGEELRLMGYQNPDSSYLVEALTPRGTCFAAQCVF